MSTEAPPTRGRGRGRRGFARGRGAYGGPRQQAAPQKPVQAAQVEEEAGDVKDLRAKYGGAKLKTVKELFPDWGDEDVLFALQDANGDVELTIMRISDGHAQQFSAVKSKKPVKKEMPSHSSGPPVRGAVGERGGRGRGGQEGGRGGRGGRGVRGRGAGLGRPPYVNGDSAPNGRSSTSVPTVTGDASFTDVSSTDQSGWGDSVRSASTPASTDGWGASTEVSTTATTGWGDEPAPSINGDEERARTPTSSLPVPSAPSSANGWLTQAAPPAEPAAKPKLASKVVAPGTKMSWAQIARPPQLPKPAPPRPAPVVKPPAAVIPAPQAPIQSEAIISIPTIEPESVQNVPPVPPAAFAATAPGPLHAWGATTPAPLGLGQGWADAVVASHDTVASYRPPDVQAHLNNADIDTAGEISVTTPVAEPHAAVAQQDKLLETGPPGLTKMINARPHQEPAVMPLESVAAFDRLGVQFGSLNVFDEKATAAPQVPEPAAQGGREEQHSYAQEPPLQPQHVDQYQHPKPHVPEPTTHQARLQDQGVQTPPFTQPAANPFQQSAGFPSRFGAFGAPLPLADEPQQQFLQQTQPSQPQAYQGLSPSQVQQTQQLQQSQVTSPYGQYKQDPSAQYLQQAASQQISATNPGQGQQGQGAHPSNYAFAGTPNQPNIFAANPTDYASVYGHDALRNMGFYDYNGQQNAPPSNAFQSPAPAAREEATKGTQQSASTQAQQGPASSQQQQGYPAGMMPYYNPYGYYQGYNPQSYAQVPPNYQYSLPQSYFGMQYGGRGMQNQYLPQHQPSHQSTHSQAPQQSAGAFRQGQSIGGMNAQQQAGMQQSYAGHGGYAPQSMPQQHQHQHQPQERKDPYGSAKDIDRWAL